MYNTTVALQRNGFHAKFSNILTCLTK